MADHSDHMQIQDNSVPVIVLVSSQHGGVGIIRSLGRLGIPVYGVHKGPWEPAARSRYLKGVFRWDFSSASSSDSVAFLVDIVSRVGGRPILVPTSDITAVFASENAKALSEAYLLSTASAEVVRSLSSKHEMFKLCQKLGVPTSHTMLPQTREDVLNFAHANKFPVIVKGESGEFLQKNGIRGRVAIVANEKDLLKIYDTNTGINQTQLLLQEYIPGGDDTIWMFNGYFNERSECLFGATGRKLRQFPAHRGSTSLGICLKNDVVATQIIQLMQALSYRGPLDVGCRFDARDGQYKLLDVNPRIGATFRLFVSDNDMDVVRALYLDLTGQTVASGKLLEGRKWIVESNDLISSWTYIRERKLTLGGWLKSLRGVQEGVWLASDDLRPLSGLPRLWFRKHSNGVTERPPVGGKSLAP